MNELGLIIAKCDEAAYQVLSDRSVSKTTSQMSEEGREAVAANIAKKLQELLENYEASSVVIDDTIWINARPYKETDFKSDTT